MGSKLTGRANAEVFAGLLGSSSLCQSHKTHKLKSFPLILYNLEFQTHDRKLLK